MLKKRLFFGFCICLFAVSPLWAANISFLVMEIAPSPEGLGKQYPVLWENNLLDVFFEEGHIVSNSRMMRDIEKIPSGFPDEAEKDFNDAKEGGMDYFIIAIVDHSQSRVLMRLFKTNSQKVLQEERFAISTYKPNKDEVETIKAAIRAIAVHID